MVRIRVSENCVNACTPHRSIEFVGLWFEPTDRDVAIVCVCVCGGGGGDATLPNWDDAKKSGKIMKQSGEKIC